MVAVRSFSRLSAWGYSTWRSASGCTTRRSPAARTLACPTSSTRPCDERLAQASGHSAEPRAMAKSNLLIEDRGDAATTGAEGIFAEMLAEVLRVDRVSVDSHFFDELGADSLLMAHFCARVRKRGNMPSVSMRDIYRHPTIRSLAAAFADVAPSSAKSSVAAAIELPTPTSAREYVLCGALQALCLLAYSYAAVVAITEG